MAVRWAIKWCQVLPDAGQVDERINRSEHVVWRDVRFDRELVEQSTLRFLPGTHHRCSPQAAAAELNQRSTLQASRVFQRNTPIMAVHRRYCRLSKGIIHSS